MPYFYQSPIEPMKVAREELDNQQAQGSAEAHVLAPEIDNLVEHAIHDLVEHTGTVLNPIVSREHAGKRITDKGKEKVDEKMNEPVFIRGVPLVDLDDLNVTDNKLLYDSIDSNDDNSRNADSIVVCDGLGSCSQTMDSNVESASTSVAPEVGEYSESHTTPIASIHDLLFNAANKAPHLDVVIVKQEAGWF